MPRNKRKHPVSRYERIMLAAIDSLPFKFNSPGEPNMRDPYEKPKITKSGKIVKEHQLESRRYRNERQVHISPPKIQTPQKEKLN